MTKKELVINKLFEEINILLNHLADEKTFNNVLQSIKKKGLEKEIEELTTNLGNYNYLENSEFLQILKTTSETVSEYKQKDYEIYIIRAIFYILEIQNNLKNDKEVKND